MPHRRIERLQRIKDVEREHAVSLFAVSRLVADAQRDPTVVSGSELQGTRVGLRDLRKTAEHLEGTYLIRLFAEFETGLRDFWAASRGREPPARTRDLLDSVAAMRQIPAENLDEAHRVREYRNQLVHERDDAVAPVHIAAARGILCTFFSFLPLQW